MVLPFGRVMVHTEWSNITVQPWLQSGATASNDVCMSGKMCACLAAEGSPAH